MPLKKIKVKGGDNSESRQNRKVEHMIGASRSSEREKGIKKSGMLSGGQAKLDKNKNNRIDAQDFKILRKEKARGRGQGLQDEKMKPGKPMKAALGAIALGLGAKKMMDKKGKKMPPGMGAAAFLAKKKKDFLGKRMGGEMKKDSTKPINPADRGIKKRMAERAMRAAKATKVGKIAAGVAGVGLAAKAYLNKKLEESKAKKKAKGKMGGGMMKKYKSGGPVPVEKIKKAFPKASPGKVARMQTMLGDKTAPMKKERLFEGDRGRRKEFIKKIKGVAKTTPIGLGIKAVETAKKLKEKMSKKMGGGMMQRPGYNVGGSVTVKTKLGRNKPTKMY